MRANRFSVHARKRFPVVAAIVRAIHIAGLLVLDAPGGHIDVFGILRIDGDVIEHIVIAAQMRQARPVMPAIVRQEQCSGAGAEVDTIGILRVEIQTPNIAPVRPQGCPLAGPQRGSRDMANSQCNQCLT